MKKKSQVASMAPVKNRNNDRKKLCLLYGFTLFALTLSIAVGSIRKSDESNALAETIHPVFFINLHSIACITLISMSLYFEIHHKETFERVHLSTGPVPFSVKYSAKGEKINLYLRLGLLMFSIMSIGYNVARLNNTDEKLEQGRSIVEILFFIFQTLFILRYHRIVILYHKTFFGALLVHLMATNLCTWTDVSVSKIYHLLSKHDKNQSHPTNDHIDDYHLEDTNYSIATYLMPTVSEYSLLAAALFYELTVRIGEPSYIELKELMTGTEIPLLDKLEILEENSDNAQSFGNGDEDKSKKTGMSFLVNCSFKSGLGCHISIATVMVIAILTIFISTMKKNYWMTYLLFVEELLLHTTGVICTIFAFRKTRKLKFSIATKQSLVDEFLLYLALFFTANYIISNIINATLTVHTLNDLNSHRKILLTIRAILDSIELVQSLLQTYFIQDSFHRCCDQTKHREEKPGRQLVALLLGINLALWILKSFQMKKGDIFNDIHQDLVMSKILIVISLPLNLFYRYHCTVCLSQCFTKLYEEETRRFEEMWRFESGHFTELLSLPSSICNRCNAISVDGLESPVNKRKFSENYTKVLPPLSSSPSNSDIKELRYNKFNSQKINYESLKYGDKDTYGSSEVERISSDNETGKKTNKRTSFDLSGKSGSIYGKLLDTPVHKTLKSLTNSLDPKKADVNIFKRSFSRNGEKRRRTIRNMETAKYRVLAAELAHQMVIHRANPGPDPGALLKRRFTSALPEVFKKSDSHNITSACEMQGHDLLDAIQATAAMTVAPSISNSKTFTKILQTTSKNKMKSSSILFSLPEEDYTYKNGKKSSNDTSPKLNQKYITSPLDISTNSSQSSLENIVKFSESKPKIHKETKL